MIYQKLAENMEGKGFISMEFSSSRQGKDTSSILFYNFNNNGHISLFCKSIKGSGGK